MKNQIKAFLLVSLLVASSVCAQDQSKKSSDCRQLSYSQMLQEAMGYRCLSEACLEKKLEALKQKPEKNEEDFLKIKMIENVLKYNLDANLSLKEIDEQVKMREKCAWADEFAEKHNLPKGAPMRFYEAIDKDICNENERVKLIQQFDLDSDASLPQARKAALIFKTDSMYCPLSIFIR